MGPGASPFFRVAANIASPEERINPLAVGWTDVELLGCSFLLLLRFAAKRVRGESGIQYSIPSNISSSVRRIPGRGRDQGVNKHRPVLCLSSASVAHLCIPRLLVSPSSESPGFYTLCLGKFCGPNQKPRVTPQPYPVTRHAIISGTVETQPHCQIPT